MTTAEWPFFAQPLNNLSGVLRRMHSRVSLQTTYCGIQTMKNPTDAWVYEELIWRLRPDVIVEVGSYKGGHLLKMAHQCDMMNHGHVIGIDYDKITAPLVVEHQRITLLIGDAIEHEQVQAVHDLVNGHSAFVIDDSSHSEFNTLSVLRLYSDLIRPDGYIVIEDTIGIEAMRAINIFLAENNDFESDLSLEDFGVSWNPNGYLRRR